MFTLGATALEAPVVSDLHTWPSHVIRRSFTRHRSARRVQLDRRSRRARRLARCVLGSPPCRIFGSSSSAVAGDTAGRTAMMLPVDSQSTQVHDAFAQGFVVVGSYFDGHATQAIVER
jgi:hypothetical protein